MTSALILQYSTYKQNRKLGYTYRVGQKSRPLSLTLYIFKTSEPICVIFGILQHCFVLNTLLTLYWTNL